jgi:transcriptional regulator with XRE-family HTH domain
MARYEVRNFQLLRDCMALPLRAVPYTVRTLADEVGANRSTVGYLLTGERKTVDEDVAKNIAEVFGVKIDDLFAPVEFPSGNGEAEQAGGES